MSSKTNLRPRRARVKPAEWDTMMEAASAGISAPVLGAPITLLDENAGRIGPMGTKKYIPDSENRMERPSAGNSDEALKGIPLRDTVDGSAKLFENPIDTTVHATVVDSRMSESPVLRAELERFEAKIVECRKQELEIEATMASKIAEDQKRLRDVREDRAGIERLAAAVRQLLLSPAEPAPAHPATEMPSAAPPDGPPQLRIVPASPRRAMQEGSKRERSFNVIKKVLLERGGPVHRGDFLDALVEAGLLDDTVNPGASLSAMLTHYKNYGLVTTDNQGMWSLVSFDQHPLQRSYNKTKTVER